MGIRIPHISVNVDFGEKSTSGELNMLAVGFGFYQTWIYFSSPILTRQAASPYLADTFLLTLLVFVCSLFVFVFSRRTLSGLYTSRQALICASVLTSGGTLIGLAGEATGTFGDPLSLISGFTTGIGSAALLLFWGCAFSRQNATTIIVNTTVAVILSTLAYTFAYSYLPALLVGILASLCPLGGVLCLWASTPKFQGCQSKTLKPSSAGNLYPFFVFRLGIPMVLFGFALGYFRETSLQIVLASQEAGLELFLFAFAGILSLFVFTLVSVFDKSVRWDFPLQALIPLIAIAIFVLPLAKISDSTFAKLVLFTSFICFEALLWTLLCRLSKSFQLSPISIFGIGRGCLVIGTMLGIAYSANLDFLSERLPFGVPSGAVLVLTAMLVAWSISPHEKEIRESASERTDHGNDDAFAVDTSSNSAQRKSESAQQLAHRAAFIKRSEAVANRYLLSQREREVLFFLGKGYNAARIQEELYISEGTAKTHIHHIYRKLDIHTQQELINMIDEEELPS
ncbi:MAG: LuxR C-terminal-related transcriptional regulator [Gordonibacter sp.]|uniref:helix-turn-helix transcriptional regulator n=1 Tax=Gordonibacter sp. TaxID=1968902 RepID=UPI002FCA06B8